MIDLTRTIAGGKETVAEIEKRSGQDISACYQCGTCTATCAGTFAFDIPPHRVMRYLQLGMVDEVLGSSTGQLCYDCMTCSSRCPVRIDVALVIETAKNISDERGIPESERGLRLFRQLFLKNVNSHGRLHEASLLAWFNIRSGRLFEEFSLMPLILRKKKVHLNPRRIRNRAEIRRIFKKAKDYPKLS